MAHSAGARGLTSLGLLLAAAAACSPGPRPLAYGTETCAHCHMTLADPRFASELVTRTGRIIPFDDVGCLATFVATGGIAAEEIHSLWVNDFAHPDSMVEAPRAIFLSSDAIRTPMDYRMVAFRASPDAEGARSRLGGELITWDEVLRRRGRPAP